MRRRVAILIGAVVLSGAVVFACVGVQWASSSDATFTTTSQSDVTASAATTSDWLNVYSEGGDPGVSADYAHQHNVSSDPLAASGTDSALAIDWGSYPDVNDDYVFVRAFSIRAALAFPDPAVTQVTVTATLVADASGTQPLKNPDLRPLGLAPRKARSTSLTLGPGQRGQLDITVHTRKNPWNPGDTFRPHIVLTATYAGGPASYYVYDITTLLTVI